MQSVSQIGTSRKRAWRACQRCHGRKVRCDGVVNGFPCTNCRLDHYDCVPWAPRNGALVKQSVRPTLNDKGAQTVRHLQHKSKASGYRRYSNTKSNRGMSDVGFPNAICGTTDLRLSGDVLSRISLPFSFYPFIKATGLRQLNPTQVAFLESQGCLHLPTKSVTDMFVHNYFLYVHPFLPLLDEATFWQEYRLVSVHGDGISILLFHTMLFAAGCFIPVEAAQRCGYDSLISLRDALYLKSKLLYESDIEDDPLTICQASLLLSHYTSDLEPSANSEWLGIAIKYAKIDHINRYNYLAKKHMPKMKRVWWCCLIRDRIISLGMHCPIQILPQDFDLKQHGLTLEDLKHEIANSEAYKPDTKSALGHVLASLCQFVVAVTDLTLTLYPAANVSASKANHQNTAMEELERARLLLLNWELDWMGQIDSRGLYPHPSIALYTNLIAIYHHSARIALCNRMCLLTDETDMERFGRCQSELVTSVESITNNVKQLLTNRVADRLPISAVAYTMLPQILLSVQSQLSTSEDKVQQETILVLLTEVNRQYSMRYYTGRVLSLMWGALWLCQEFTSSSVNPAREDKRFDTKSPSHVFQLRPREYMQLLRYVDESMTVTQDAIEANSISFRANHTPSSSALPVSSTPGFDVSVGVSDTVWMEPMDNLYSGPRTELSQSSPRAEGLFDSHSDAVEHFCHESEMFQDLMNYLPLLGE